MNDGSPKSNGLMESWGQVALEMLQHPFKSGLSSVALGTTSVILGGLVADPYMAGAGVLLVGLGGLRMRDFIRSHRGGPGGPSLG